MASNFIIVSDDYKALQDKILEIQEGLEVSSEPIIYNLAEEKVYSLIDEITTVSLFDETKFIIVKSSSELLKTADKPFMELLKAMNSPQNNNILIITFVGSVDVSCDAFQKLKRFSSFYEIKTKNIDFNEYALKRFNADGYSILDSDIKLLTSYCDSLSKLNNYIDQLESYKLDEKSIDNDDILLLVTPPLDDNVYALIEAVLVDNKSLMLKCYKDMKLRSMQASTLVSLLINKFQELYDVNLLIKNGMNQASIAELFGISSGRAYYMIKNAKEQKITTIKKHLDLLNDLDYRIKTGKIDQNLGLELYFLS